MADIRLSPSGRLALDLADSDVSPALRALDGAFAVNWREGLFLLAAKSSTLPPSPTLRFWGDLAAQYLTRLCHLPATQDHLDVTAPAPEELESWIESAPPMRGGEYLNPDLLAGTWAALAGWAAETITADGGLEAFLRKRAPGWNKVGKVTFHLAENRNDPDRPFAFMASFTTGVGPDGRPRHLPLRKALEIYAGTRNKPALIKLLTPVQEAAKRCNWVRSMVDAGDIYRPMAWTAPRAYRLLRSTPLLEESGLSILLPDWWKKRPKPQVSVTIGDPKQRLLSAGSLLQFHVDVTLDGTPVSPEELDELLAGEDGLVLFKGQWVEVDRQRLQQALDHWQGLKRQVGDGGLSFIQGMRLLAGTSPDLSDDPLDKEARPWAHVAAGQGLRETLARLRDPARLDARPPLEGLRATLRPYQQEGLAWLDFLTHLGLGACLADDMGLGKTLQVLALLTSLNARERRDPSLLVIPASLLGNWRFEARRFAPALRLLFAHPSEMSKKDMDALGADPGSCLKGCDLVVTTYALVDRTPWFARQKWDLIILDEAQAIKNHATRQSRAVRRLAARARIALTGTPVENRLGDLWSLFDFLNPGLLGTAAQFKRFIKGMEAQESNTYAPLRRLVGPYILRRLKTDKSVIADLPDKTETVRYCALSREQIKLYGQVVQAMEKALKQDLVMDNMARRGLVLQTMMRLKQICNHPVQFTGHGDFAPDKSGKFVRLAEICQELADRQEKALIFTQFKEIIPPLEDHLAEVFGRPGLHLHGGTRIKDRRAIVEQFQREDGPPFFLLSLKAGGTGLNLTAASHVIHFDRWWNPAVENQATDRAFRIGQKKNVLVHKFVVAGTIEEKIDQMITGKKELAENLLSEAGEIRLTELPDEELLSLVRLDLTRAAENG